MQEYIKLSLILSTFGFLKEIRPSEPFITPYLTDPRWRNVTEDEVLREAFPIGTYSYLAHLVIVFLITDYFRYKPLILVLGVSGIIVWSLLLWTTTLLGIQILEVFYGTYMATEVAYFTYIYAKVDKEHYQKVTSHTRAALLSGKFLAAVTGQVLIYTSVMEYRQLNYLTLAAQIMATIWALFIPPVQNSMYFHQKESAQTNLVENGNQHATENSNKVTGAFELLWTHFTISYSNKRVILWSFWYALGMCLYIQIISYIQFLWLDIDKSQENTWNGLVEAIATVSGAISTVVAGKIQSSFLRSQRRTLLIIMIVSVIQGGLIIFAAKTSSLYVNYTLYIFYLVFYSFTICVSGAEIAKSLIEDCFGLVFGINTLVGIGFQTVLTALVTSSHFGLSVSMQYSIYGYLYLVLGGIYLLGLVYEIFKIEHISIDD